MTTHDVRTQVWSSHREAEHGFALLGRAVTNAATHVAASTSTVLVTVGVDGRVEVLGSAAPEDAELAREMHAGRQGGRLFVFSGSTALVGEMTVGELVERSAVDEVVMGGHREQGADEQRIDTQGFVRPHLVDGVVRLVVRPAVGGLVVPFEQPRPTPCCADH